MIKRTLPTLIFLMTLLSISEASVIKRKINKDTNPILTNNIIFYLFQDSEGKVWINSNNHLIRSATVDCEDWNDYSDTITKNLLLKDIMPTAQPDFKGYNIKNDKYGNLIFHTSGGLGIFYKKTEDWDFFVRDNPDLPSYSLVVYNNDIAIDSLHDRIFLSGHRDTMYYAQLDYETKRYIYEDRGGVQYLVLPDSGRVVRTIHFKNDSLRVFSKCKSFFYDEDLNLVYNISSEDDNLTDVDYYGLSTNSIRTYVFQYIESSNKYLWRWKNQVFDMYIDGGKIREANNLNIESKSDNFQSFFSAWIDRDKDSLFFGNWSEMWILDVRDNSLYEVPRPAEFGDDLNQEWAAKQALIIPEKNELWLANSNYGITVYDLKAILDSAVPVAVTDSEVEINTFFPMLGGAKAYPIPATGLTKIDFYQQEGLPNEVEVKVYDTSGAEMNINGITVTSNSGIKRTATVPTANLNQGVYIIIFKYKEHSCSVKIIV
jgi:hypothetical protein